MVSVLQLVVIVLMLCTRRVQSSTFVSAPPRSPPENVEGDLTDEVRPPGPPIPVEPPAPPPPIQPPSPPTAIITASTPAPPTTTKSSKKISTSIYSHYNSTKIFGQKIKGYSQGRSYRTGRTGFSDKGGENREQRSRSHNKQSFHVYAIPGPRPVPVVPTAPTPPPLPPIIITQTVTTTGGPPAPLIPGGPAPIIIGGPPAPLVPGGPAPIIIGGAPAPLIPGAPAPIVIGAPAPLSSVPQATPASGALAQNIKCAVEGRSQRLTANIRRPNGFSSQPVFNDASGINSLSDTNCRMTPLVSSSNQFLVEVNNFKACGVKMQRQGADNKEWMVLTVRFPFISGLRLAEDEYIMVMCRPQDTIKTQNHALDLRGNVAKSSKSVFSSGPQNFQCDIALFRIGTTGSAEKINSGTAIEIGEKLQLRGEIRGGDGWKFARLTDVVVKRVVSSSSATPGVYTASGDVASNIFRKTITRIQASGHGRKKRARIYGLNQQSTPLSDVAFLVLSDGCRNPTFKPIAPYHPWRDEKNPLAVNFLFRAFMFQNMRDGDSIRITARVIACVRKQDCQYRTCSDDAGHGFGRKKRTVGTKGSVEYFNIDKEIFANGTVKDNSNNNVTNFDRNMDVVIVTPGHLQRKLEQKTEEAAKFQSFTEQTPSYNVLLMTTIISATAFTISTLVIISIVLKNRRSKKYTQKDDNSERKNAAKLQRQMAVVAAATAAATVANHSVHSPAYVSSTPGYYNSACESDPEYYDHKTLRKAHSKVSIRSNHSNCSKKRTHYRRHSVHRCDSNCYSSDDTYTESEEDIKCSVV